MELQLRVIFLILGLLILLGVVLDFYRRRPQKQAISGNFSDSEQDRDLLKAIMMRRQQTLQQNFQQTPNLDIEPRFTSIEEDEYDTNDEYQGVDMDVDLDIDSLPEDLYEDPVQYEYEPEDDAVAVSEVPQNLIVVYIMSRNPAGFYGAELHRALTSAYMHIGKNDIFYRYEKENGEGEALFSVAKATEPGYFDLDYMDDEQVPGIVLLMMPDKLSDPLLALDKLSRTAKQIAFALNGELLDQNRQALTLMTLEGYKAKFNSKI